MKNYVKVTGLLEIEAILNKELATIKVDSERGMIKAFAFIRRETESSSPKTPVEYGNLRASWFVATHKRAVVGKGSAKFNGPDGAKIATEHEEQVTQAVGETKVLTTPSRVAVMGGYTANYATLVHEKIGVRNWSRAGSGPKW